MNIFERMIEYHISVFYYFIVLNSKLRFFLFLTILSVKKKSSFQKRRKSILSYLTHLLKVSIKGSFLFPLLYFKFVRQDQLLLLFIFILFKQARTFDVDVVLILYCERTVHNRKINSLIFEDDFDGVVVIICSNLIESFQQNYLPD